MEWKTAYDSGVLVKAKRPGSVEYVDANRIVIRPDKLESPDDTDVISR